jgi:hypothetical protein
MILTLTNTCTDTLTDTIINTYTHTNLPILEVGGSKALRVGVGKIEMRAAVNIWWISIIRFIHQLSLAGGPSNPMTSCRGESQELRLHY